MHVPLFVIVVVVDDLVLFVVQLCEWISEELQFSYDVC